MDKAVPFVDFFPNVYPERRSVNLETEPNLVGVMIKSVFFHTQEEALLCRGLVVHARGIEIYSTVHLKVKGIAPVVGYDMDLIRDQDGEEETWELVRGTWSKHMVAQPVSVSVLHDDIKRKVNAQVFPLRCIALARKYVRTVRGALTFGDICPDKGYYMARDGNTPALCSDVMFGRVYFVPENKLNQELSASDLIYDREICEAEAKLFDGKHMPYFYKAACLDIETVFDKSYRDPRLHSRTFAYAFPYCTESRVADMTEYRSKLVCTLNAGRLALPKGCKHVSVPALAPDMPGEQHEITCVSLVILNSHVPKGSPGDHRKTLIVLYNKCKVRHEPHPEADHELARGAGIDQVSRVEFHPCSGELALLEATIRLLYRHGIEQLYVYNAEFDVRVIEQRVHFYAESKYAESADPATRKLCSSLLGAWNGLFVTRALATDVLPTFQFENVRYLDMYRDMLKSVGSVLNNGTLTEHKLELIATYVGTFNRDKAKLGHFKMNSCGMNIVDLYRMAGTREIKFACTSMKLNDVAPFVIASARQLHRKPPKDTRKLCKLSDVSYARMDDMMRTGGKGLFAVLLYNLVDSQLCARLAKVLNPVSVLFHRCRTTLNIDVVVHGRGDNFGGFVQSIHSVQIPQLKFRLDTLRVKAGTAGMRLESRLRWAPEVQSEHGHGGEQWKGGAVYDPLTGLHYSGPGMGLELAFDFSGMYPSIMCALNISPETTIPWPPVNFPHDLSGWVCYNWEAEGFEYASLILKYDPELGCFARAPAVFSSSVEYFLNRRAEFKRKLKNPEISEAERVYYKMQEVECKVLANSFYGTAPHPCGPLISGHGRQQISVVNGCVSSFYQHRCPVVYGDTDSVMVAVGYGPGDIPESDVPEAEVSGRERLSGEAESELLEGFARKARTAIGDKFKRVGEKVPSFLDYVHKALVEDTLGRMYVIGRGNAHQKLVRDPGGTYTEEGYPVYLGRDPGSGELADVTGPFVKDRRVKLEYENSCSVYCHVAKKTYMALTHTLDEKGDLSSVSLKVRGLAAFKSMRSPCDSAVTETFIACVMRGDCVKLEMDKVSCFSTSPWHRLQSGDVILYLEREPGLDEFGAWLELDRASSFLSAYRVEEVAVLQLDSGFSAVSTRLVPEPGEGCVATDAVTVRTLYKDGEYCMNHMFSRKQAILRDLVTCKASELIASKMGAGFFPWSALIKSSKNKHFSRQTLDRLKVSNSSVKTTYVEIVRTWLKQITGLSVKPVECDEYHKCSPCEAAFYRYPLNLQAKAGCIAAMFGGSLICETECAETDKDPRGDREHPERPEDGVEQNGGAQVEPRCRAELISHPYQPTSKCFANSRVLIAHLADRTLVNGSGKLVAHCIIDYCLPGYMYSSALGARSLRDCKEHLLASIASVRGRLKRAGTAFNTVMNNCPEHMIPACGARDLEHLRTNRETLTRIPSEKLDTCLKVITEDMSLKPKDVYGNLSALLGQRLTEAMSEGIVSLEREEKEEEEEEERSPLVPGSNASISLSVPSVLLTDAGMVPATGISVARSELRERTLVDLAGLLYQTVLLLQVRTPEVFVSAEEVMYPEHVLCIMPYSRADAGHMRTWIERFAEKRWLKPKRVTLGKRTRTLADCMEVTYHCAGCKNFYRDLFANKVPAHELIQRVYGQDKRRTIGQCVNEKRWLS